MAVGSGKSDGAFRRLWSQGESIDGAAHRQVPEDEDIILGRPIPTHRRSPGRESDHLAPHVGQVQDRRSSGGRTYAPGAVGSPSSGQRSAGSPRFAREGSDLAMVQAIAGHGDLKLTSQVYTHLGAEDLRKAMDGIPLRSGAWDARVGQ